MTNILNLPRLVFVLAFIVLWLAARIGVSIRKRRGELPEALRDDFGLIQAFTLTFLGLIIGFTFSMAITRYDQRKNLEAEEANAIGTEYVRANLLSAAAAEQTHALLRDYLDQRILYYTTRGERQLGQIDGKTTQLQRQLWGVIEAQAAQAPTPITVLVAAGMNDVLNSQGYTLAAWRNRIPASAWTLLFVTAVVCNVLIGFGAHHPEGKSMLLIVVPLVVSIAFLLVADIDSARFGVIRVHPQNLVSLSEAFRSQ